MTSQNAMTLLFKQHIQPRFLSKRLVVSEGEMLSGFWAEDAEEGVRRKVEEHVKYKGDVGGWFSDGGGV